MPKSAIVVYSLSYPFEQGEEFLDAELPHLANQFDRVVLIPTLHTSGMTQTRHLPPGVTLVTPGNSYKREVGGIARFCMYHPLAAGASALRALRAGPKPARIWRDLKFDLRSTAVAHAVSDRLADLLAFYSEIVLYAFWLHVPARTALECRRLLDIAGAPVVSRANGFDLYLERHPDRYLPQRDRLLRGLDLVLAASSSAEEYLHTNFPAHRQKYSVDRIGTGPAINPGNAQQSALHAVSCSYISPVKRLPMLIDDVAAAQARGMRLRWTHIGTGTGPYPNEVEAYAARKLTPGSFTFLGHMENADLRRWYAENPASVFVHVPEFEGGLAASIQEALAQGLPVIATDVGGVSALRETDLPLFDGLLDAQHTPEQFADRVERLITSDAASYARYAAASVAYWQENCSAEVLAVRLAGRLRHIATTGRTQTAVAGPAAGTAT